MKDTDTPETDEQTYDRTYHCMEQNRDGAGCWVSSEFARKLERERDEARAAMQWRPIETLRTVAENGMEAVWLLPSGDTIPVVGFVVHGRPVSYISQTNVFTHWMPLPPNPNPQDDE